MYEHNALGYRWTGLMFDKGQKQSSALSCDSSYLYMWVVQEVMRTQLYFSNQRRYN